VERPSLIAQAHLTGSSGAVANGLRTGLPSGRSDRAMIVRQRYSGHGRQRCRPRRQIRVAAENMSDGVVAPLFLVRRGRIAGLAALTRITTLPQA